jgi:serine/threonine protein kinase
MSRPFAPQPSQRMSATELRCVESTAIDCSLGASLQNSEAPSGPLATPRYRLGRLLGWGGMGLVYEATHLALDLPVALKMLRPELSDCDDGISAFLDEAHWLGALSHEHIVRVLDAGQLDNGLPFFVMERLEGCDLQGVLSRCGRLAPAVAAQYALQACSALSEVHRAGLIHCDVKPSNLFLACIRGAPARVKLLDFGIARSSQDSASEGHWSDSDLVAGSPLYSSPEQLQATSNLDQRTDIWSLGLVLFEMLTGLCPFAAETIAETHARVLLAPAPRVRDVRPEIDPRLAGAVEMCLHKDRQRRFSTVQELALALHPFVA